MTSPERRSDRGLAPPGWRQNVTPGGYPPRQGRGALHPAGFRRCLPDAVLTVRGQPALLLCSPFKATLPSMGVPLDRPSSQLYLLERIKNLEVAHDPSVVAGPA